MAVNIRAELNGAVQGDGARSLTKRVTFTGAAGTGAVGTVVVATVTGAVLIDRIVPYCVTNVGVNAGLGIASMQLGIVGETDRYNASTVATDIDAGDFWISSTPTATAIDLAAGLSFEALNANIVIEVTTTDAQLVNAGVIDFLIVWRPVSSGARIT